MTKIIIAGLLLPSLAIGVTLEQRVQTVNSSLFPRLAVIDFTGKLEESSNQQQLAKWDLVIVGASYPPKKFIASVKAKNPDSLIGLYTVINEARVTIGSTLSNNRKLKLDKEKWWLTDADGNKVSWANSDQNSDVNVTAWSGVDSRGRSYIDWITTFWYSQLFSVSTYADIWFFDNVFQYPNVNYADWRVSGYNQNGRSNEIQTEFRKAQAKEVAIARKLSPTRLFIANADNDLSSPEYKGIFNGAMMECVFGHSWSTFTTEGWHQMMERYKNTTQNLLAPKIVIFGTCLPDFTDYQSFRFSFASSLLGNGYYEVSDVTSSYIKKPWFDEFDIELGLPVDPAFPKPKDNGLYVREFSKGLVIVNPTSSSQSIIVSDGYKYISGVQDSAVNKGGVAKSVVLAAEDGLILVKE